MLAPADSESTGDRDLARSEDCTPAQCVQPEPVTVTVTVPGAGRGTRRPGPRPAQWAGGRTQAGGSRGGCRGGHWHVVPRLAPRPSRVRVMIMIIELSELELESESTQPPQASESCQ
jgi:hypothetical protein